MKYERSDCAIKSIKRHLQGIENVTDDLMRGALVDKYPVRHPLNTKMRRLHKLVKELVATIKVEARVRKIDDDKRFVCEIDTDDEEEQEEDQTGRGYVEIWREQERMAERGRERELWRTG